MRRYNYRSISTNTYFKVIHEYNAQRNVHIHTTHTCTVNNCGKVFTLSPSPSYHAHPGAAYQVARDKWQEEYNIIENAKKEHLLSSHPIVRCPSCDGFYFKNRLKQHQKAKFCEETRRALEMEKLGYVSNKDRHILNVYKDALDKRLYEIYPKTCDSFMDEELINFVETEHKISWDLFKERVGARTAISSWGVGLWEAETWVPNDTFHALDTIRNVFIKNKITSEQLLDTAWDWLLSDDENQKDAIIGILEMQCDGL